MEYHASVAIIGAGPLGIELAISLKTANISYIQFDKAQIAQAIYNFPPQTHFFSSPEKISLSGARIQTLDQQKCTREVYLAYLRTLVFHYQLNVNTYEEVIQIIPLGAEGFKLTTLSAIGKQEYLVRTVVLATGSTSTPRKLNVIGEDLKHVSTRMGDAHQYFGKKVIIVGGKNSAAETALRCFHVGAQVTLIVRKKELDLESIKYWILPELMSRIQHGEIHCLYDSEIQEIKPNLVKVKKKELHDLLDVSTDFVIKAIGFKADLHFCKELGIQLGHPPQEAPKYNEATMETNVPGVFLLGTIVGGNQNKYLVFIENTHDHVEKIVRTLIKKLGETTKPRIHPTALPTPEHLEE